VVHVIEHLTNKSEVLSSKPQYCQGEEKGRKRERERERERKNEHRKS
jgi:hypothetical protein